MKNRSLRLIAGIAIIFSLALPETAFCGSGGRGGGGGGGGGRSGGSSSSSGRSSSSGGGKSSSGLSSANNRSSGSSSSRASGLSNSNKSSSGWGEKSKSPSGLSSSNSPTTSKPKSDTTTKKSGPSFSLDRETNSKKTSATSNTSNVDNKIKEKGAMTKASYKTREDAAQALKKKEGDKLTAEFKEEPKQRPDHIPPTTKMKDGTTVNVYYDRGRGGYGSMYGGVWYGYDPFLDIVMLDVILSHRGFGYGPVVYTDNPNYVSNGGVGFGFWFGFILLFVIVAILVVVLTNRR